MSDTTDDMEHFFEMMEGSVEYIEEAYEEGSLEWTTRDGKEINVEDMTVSHLGNTISMLKRQEKHPILDAWIRVLTSEFQRRTR